MITLWEAIRRLQDGRRHSVRYVSRKDGHIVEMRDVIVTSSNYERKKLNLRGVKSRQVRWMYYLLLLELDGEEVMI